MTTRTPFAAVPGLVMPAAAGDVGRGVVAPAPPVSKLPVVAERAGGVYGLARVDHRGRVAAAVVERALGWTPGVRLHIGETGGVIVVCADDQGVFTVSSQGHVCLPVSVRRWCGLETGDQVLLVVGPSGDRLFVCPAAKLDELLVGVLSAASGGRR